MSDQNQNPSGGRFNPDNEGYYQNTAGGQEQYAEVPGGIPGVPVPAAPFGPNGTFGIGPVRPSVNFQQGIQLFFKNYANFYGRASSSEFWYSFLFLTLVNLLIYIIAMLVGNANSTAGTVISVISWIFGLATAIPSVAISVRRLHDAGKSGFWNFIALIPLVGIIILIVFWAGQSSPEGVKFDNPDGSQPASIEDLAQPDSSS